MTTNFVTRAPACKGFPACCCGILDGVSKPQDSGFLSDNLYYRTARGKAEFDRVSPLTYPALP